MIGLYISCYRRYKTLLFLVGVRVSVRLVKVYKGLILVFVINMCLWNHCLNGIRRVIL